MKARDLFGVALRVLGIWFLYQAGDVGILAIMKMAGVPNGSAIPAVEDKIFVGFYLAAAFATLVLADHIVALAYGPTATKALSTE